MSQQLPWFFAVDHLPNSGSDNNLINLALGDGAMSARGDISSVTWNSTLERRSLQTQASSTSRWTKTITPTTELTVGGRFVFTVSSSTSTYRADGVFIAIRGESSWRLYARHYWEDDRIEVLDASGTVLATSLPNTLTADVPVYVEFYAKLDDAEGAFELRLDGQTVLSGSGIDLGTTPCDQVIFGGVRIIANTTSSWAQSSFWTDLYIRESVGPEFYGPIVMRPLRPTADVSSEWTPDTGTENFSRVNETTTDRDASYIQSTEFGDRDSYDFEDLPPSANSIIALVGVTVANAVDGGAPLVATGFQRGTDVDVAEGRGIGVGSWRSQATVFPLQPNGSPWSIAAVDEAKFIIESA